MPKTKKSGDKPIFLRDYVRYNALGGGSEGKRTKKIDAEDEKPSDNEKEVDIKDAMKTAVEGQTSDSDDDSEEFFTIRVSALLFIDAVAAII